MTEQYMSAESEGPHSLWAQWRKGAAVVVVGLYLAATVRLIVSGNWNDLAAEKLFGLTGVIAALLWLVAVAATESAPGAPGTTQKRWTTSRIVAASVVAALVVGGAFRMILTRDLGDPIAGLLNQTAVISVALLFLLGGLPVHRPRN
ncbi:hypothetical protein ACFWM1_30410 [Nocardia sp. NPDC058379]|uniref:hypothetical protein n=1 Tax=unclassified Nocardia TaxID=2637762 RepID=UPI003656B303